ncbi:hypothetical protein ANO11243_097210 [Dothideomycetidae sp. 11243]|nr:hypothetical protein ANO11243_097210 [fungal sp. No.11243]
MTRQRFVPAASSYAYEYAAGHARLIAGLGSLQWAGSLYSPTQQYSSSRKRLQFDKHAGDVTRKSCVSVSVVSSSLTIWFSAGHSQPGPGEQTMSSQEDPSEGVVQEAGGTIFHALVKALTLEMSSHMRELLNSTVASTRLPVSAEACALGSGSLSIQPVKVETRVLRSADKRKAALPPTGKTAELELIVPWPAGIWKCMYAALWHWFTALTTYERVF